MINKSEGLVAHVLYSGLGGHSAVLFSLLENGFMSAHQHEVLFVGVEVPPMEYSSRCEKLGVPWHYIPKEAGKGNLRFLLKLQRKLSSLSPDVLFLHGLSAMPAVALLKAFRRNGSPFVLVRETQANHLKTKREWYYLALAHYFADRIVHLTEEASVGAKMHLGWFARSEKVSVVPNGLDMDFYKPGAPVPRDGGITHIGMQSRLQENKDHETLIDAFASVVKRYPDKSLHLHIAGDGATYDKIRDKIQESGLADSVTMHGMLDRQQLRDFLQTLDIYVHCTHGETMSTSIMQALACGLPVIASDVLGVSNMIKPEAGVLYAAGDSKDLADKLGDFICSAEKVEDYGARARVYALKNFSINETALLYEKVVFQNP